MDDALKTRVKKKEHKDIFHSTTPGENPTRHFGEYKSRLLARRWPTQTLDSLDSGARSSKTSRQTTEAPKAEGRRTRRLSNDVVRRQPRRVDRRRGAQKAARFGRARLRFSRAALLPNQQQHREREDLLREGVQAASQPIVLFILLEVALACGCG